MHERTEQNINNTRNHNTRYNVVHPQCRGYVHRTVFIFNSLQQHSYDLCTELQISAHLAADLLNNPKLRTQLQILPSKTLCALSCRGRPRTQLGLILHKTLYTLSYRGRPHT